VPHANRKPIVQISVDGFAGYPEAIDLAFSIYARWGARPNSSTGTMPFASHWLSTGHQSGRFNPPLNTAPQPVPQEACGNGWKEAAAIVGRRPF
jgi:hypothetical protein